MTVDARAHAALLALGAAPGSVRLLYENDFESAELTRRNAPIGRGPALKDAEVEGPFYYRVARVRFPDGRAGVRFVTREEQPGGHDYSTMTPQAVFRRSIVAMPVVAYAWSVHMPEIFDFAERTAYWENRVLWTTDIENVRGLAVLRFIDNRSMGFEVDKRIVGSPVSLPRPLGPSERVDLVVAVDHRLGRVIALAGDEHIGEVVELGEGLALANRDYLTSTGNTLKHDTDLGYFSALSSLAVYGADL